MQAFVDMAHAEDREGSGWIRKLTGMVKRGNDARSHEEADADDAGDDETAVFAAFFSVTCCVA